VQILKHISLFAACFFGAQIAFALHASAYIDPSAATYIIQAVAGVFIAGGAAVTIYWRKIKKFVTERNTRKP
jgi:glycerol uptake facilitator-like aquaporin